MRTLYRNLFVSLALLVSLAIFSGAASAKTIFVNEATGNDAACVMAPFTTACKTIGVAVGLLVAGDTLQIFPGFYAVAAKVAVSVPNVTIKGAGSSTIIDGSAVAAGNAILEILANNVTVQDFMIRGAVGAAFADICTIGGNLSPANVQFDPAIRVGTGTTATNGVIIRNVEVTDNAVGIAICNSNATQVISNNIHDNALAGGVDNGAGVALLASSNVTLQANRFANSPPVATEALLLAAPNTTTSTSNRIISNTFSGFIGGNAIAAIVIDSNTTNNTISRDTINVGGGLSIVPPITFDSIGLQFENTLAGGTVPINTTVEDNMFDGGNLTCNDGIRVGAPAQNTVIQRNTFRRFICNGFPGNGIDWEASDVAMNTVVRENLFIDNTYGITFAASFAGANDQFYLNEITRNAIGVRVACPPAAGANEVFVHNNIESNTVAGWSFVTVPGIICGVSANASGAFVSFDNFWGGSTGPICTPTAGCTTVGGAGNSVLNGEVGTVALPTDPVSSVPFGTVFGTSLERAPVPLAVSSIQAVGLGGFRPGLQVRVQGQGIAGVQLQVYDLSGRLVTNQSASGASLRWNELSSHDQTLANGVYLYVVTVKGYDGKIVNSEVRKMVILR